MVTPLVGARSLLACGECDAPAALDQRYCVECGARLGALPLEFSALISGSLRPAAPPQRAASRLTGVAFPTPRVATIATMCVLACGVAVGRAAIPNTPRGNAAVAAAIPSILAMAQAANAPAVVAAPPPASEPTATPPAAPAETPAATPEPKAAKPKATPAPTTAPVVVAPALPAVNHVFLIVLTDHGVDAAFGAASAAPYLATTLRDQGELLPNYYGVAAGGLANEIGLISGQGPTPQTEADCPAYVDLTPGTIGDQSQAAGTGCVYPTTVKTVADELAAGEEAWKAYVEDIGNGGPGQPATCRHPTIGLDDQPQGAFVTWRDPFVYFHSLIDGPGCAGSVVGLDQLAADLGPTGKAPTLSYIIPNRCHDGAETACAPGQPAGLAAADAFLKTVVPEIMASAAYKDGGLIGITFDQAGGDMSACCLTPTTYPNVPTGTPPYMLPPPVIGGSTPTSAPATTASPSTPAATTTTPSTTTTTPPTTTTTTPSPSAPEAFALPKNVSVAGGGGRVGLLLLSPFVAPGSVNLAAYNHYSLLASVQNLFQLPNIGYAAISGLPVFDAAVYNRKP